MCAKNRYERKARKKHFLGEAPSDGQQSKNEKRASAKETLSQTGMDALAGVAGGAAGAAFGRLSLVAGAVVNAIGNYFKNRFASVFGTGMMASGTLQLVESINGTEKKKSFFEQIKERLVNYKNAISQKLFLDKLPFGKKENSSPTTVEIPQTTAGMGEVQYFAPPAENLLGEGMQENDILKQYTDQIIKSAGNQKPILGTGDNEQVMGDTDQQFSGDIDPTDKNY